MNSEYYNNRSAIEYNRSVSPTLKDIATPLFSHMGLTHFTYARYLDGNRFMNLTIDTNLTEGFLGTPLDNYVLWKDVGFPTHTKRVVIWDAYEAHSLTDYMRHHGYDHGVSLFYRHDHDIEAWHFATDLGNTRINNLYTNHLDILEQFVLYFQEQAKDIISTSDISRLAQFHNGRSLNLNDYNPTGTLELSKEHLSQVMELKKYHFSYRGIECTLSCMEYQCLKGISEGKTAKLLARERDISPRTVESVLDRLRTKLGISCKSQLIDAYTKSIYSQIG